ncbi:MAG: glucosamine-6-phosphate deaminase, partial [Thermoguttaceae bacterium]|nr:glucosamine-6-phosphate deaminase [Thermoguttaceae bacterium]
VFESNTQASRHVANQIASIIRDRNSLGSPAVLGLVAGSSPVGVYQELVSLYQDGHLDFSKVIVFMVNEYYGLEEHQIQSQRRWMVDNFFNRINIPVENIHYFDTTILMSDIDTFCRQYEEEIQKYGSLDVVLLGISGIGSIGFNEPYSTKKSRTRLVTLDPQTRISAASSFFSEANVPTHGLTMGMETIAEAKKIIALAFGDSKASIVQKAIEAPASDAVPASWLRNHQDISFILDSSAAAQLQDIAAPWTTHQVEWDNRMIKRAVLWLCKQTGKSLLKLTDKDFRAYGLHQLIRLHGPASQISNQVFHWMFDTIEYHPGGTVRKKILAFSPHPDDDVISMGGTMIRLVDDGHELHMAYMTSGNIAVFDHDAYRFADLMTELNRQFNIDSEMTPILEEKVVESLRHKKPGQSDSPEVLLIKQLIRWSEARAADKVCGIPENQVHFLNLPFYATGTVDKKPPTEADYKMVRDLILEIQPEQIFVAGDLSDPHGTHRVCAVIVFTVLKNLQNEGYQIPEIMLYRGAWQEWDLDQIEVAVPLSPQDVDKKRSAIFRHESQKDAMLFPGSDDREFWQRAEDRNLSTAAAYNQIGLPEYFAMEAFVRWNDQFEF